MTLKPIRKALLMVLLLTLAAGGLAGCAPKTGGDVSLEMAAMEDLPAEVQSAPKTVQQAYQFAVANPETLQQIPCYCGCGAMGHTSNYACYVAEADERGVIQYDTHALGCGICVDITLDVMRLQKENKPIAEIRATIDDTYAQYGPSNMDKAGE